MRQLAQIVKAYDIRGTVPDQLNVEVATALGRACAVELQGEAVVVGRDMRPSSPELAAAFMEGVRTEGVDTIDIGLASTDLLYYASGRLGVPGAMWTASHNPAQYNGLKLCRAGAEPVSLETGLAQIRDRAIAGDFPQPPHSGSHREQDLLGEFAEHVRSFADLGVMAPLKVAIDAGNGMAGHVVPAVFDPLPIEVEASTSNSTARSPTIRPTPSS
jgi:phosphomannomutase